MKRTTDISMQPEGGRNITRTDESYPRCLIFDAIVRILPFHLVLRYITRFPKEDKLVGLSTLLIPFDDLTDGASRQLLRQALLS